MPATVAWLGYGGLLPFILLAAATALDGNHIVLWAKGLFTYAATILSFVGALHWGFAMMSADLAPAQRQRCYLWSVVPPLLAWLALLLPVSVAGWLLAAGFVAQYWQDRRLSRQLRLPNWFMPLRGRLSSIAFISLVVGAVSCWRAAL